MIGIAMLLLLAALYDLSMRVTERMRASRRDALRMRTQRIKATMLLKRNIANLN